MTGLVSLVGAGPGDPELLTLKAARRLQEADLVLYDGLVPVDTLALASRAQRFCTSKRTTRRIIEQETLNRLMIRAARRGRRVVRLKAGDPFVLGRGGEEVLALIAANVPFEVIPGLSSAVSAPALAGIPVTHRGLSSGFVMVSGHAESAYAPVLGSLEPHSATIVILMGLASRARISSLLRARGWRADTPAAVVFDASRPSQRVWKGQLRSLGRASVARSTESPGVIVVGEVVSFRRGKLEEGRGKEREKYEVRRG